MILQTQKSLAYGHTYSINMEQYTFTPKTFVGSSIIVLGRTMVWQDNIIYRGYCYLG